MLDWHKLENNPLYYGSSSMVLKKMNGFYLILNPDQPNMMVADVIGVKIFQFCDGKRSAKKVIKDASSKLQLDEENVKDYVQSLINAGFLVTTPPSSIKTTREADKLRSLVLHLTEGCNLRCKHCYFAAETSVKDELSKSEFLSVIQQFAELGGESLLITGGEPLLEKEKLYAVIKEAKKNKIDRILVNTNGTLITEFDAAFFEENHVNVGVSLDGATPITHDYIRGKGAFEKAVNGIKILLRHGITTTIGTTLMKPNLHEAPEILHLAKKLGLPSVNYVILKTKGRATNYRLTLEFTVEELMSTMKRILRTSKETGVKSSFEELQPSATNMTKRDLCGAGIGLLGLAANGDVYPCDALHEAPLRAGNIREKSLGEIWRNSPILKAFQELSVTTIEGCSSCEFKFICGNGCPADSFIVYGTFKKCSPFCPMYKEIFNYMISEAANELWKEATKREQMRP
jgi:radical SAM protein with 4Fe4S-binding SPASM domain